MRSIMLITDEELVAYLDGDVHPVRRSEIDAALAQDGRLGTRLGDLDIDKDAIRVAFDAVATAAPVDRLRARLAGHVAPPPRRRGGRRWPAIAATLVMGVALGYVIGLSNIGRPAKTWHGAIADYQALYTGATLARVPTDPVKQRQDVAAVSEQLGLPIQLEALQVPGLDYKRAQLLSFKGRPLAQFVYLDSAGVPVAFCATPTGDRDRPITIGTFHGLGAAFWSKNGRGFIVIGAAQAGTLQRAATWLAERI